MIALCVYLVAGVVVLTGMVIRSRRAGQEPSASLLLASLRGPRSWQQKVLEAYVVPALAGGLFIAGWPVGLWMVWREKRKEAQETKRNEEAKFRVRPGDLRNQTSTHEVEAAALVLDPLGAVPSQPFGHLNHVWQAFLSCRPANAELWSFDRMWTDEWSVCYRREGHVWVVNGQPGQWMLTQDQRLDRV
jgi:hypothetical protein